MASFSGYDLGESNSVLATYRFQGRVSRMQVKVRSVEGRCGTLRAYIVPNTHPKVCHLKDYGIKTLSLHHRIAGNVDESLPFNELEMEGNFSIAEMHSWLRSALPEVPQRCVGLGGVWGWAAQS